MKINEPKPEIDNIARCLFAFPIVDVQKSQYEVEQHTNPTKPQINAPLLQLVIISEPLLRNPGM